VQRIIVTIEGPGYQDVEETEVIALPEVGELITTKYGPCVVTSVEPLPESEFFGKVTCRMP
jgi:hypothetical protein